MRLNCNVCRVTVAASYLKTNMVQIQGIYFPEKRGVDEVGGGPTTYVVSLARVLHNVKYLVPGCLSVAYSAVRLREHFMYHHFG